MNFLNIGVILELVQGSSYCHIYDSVFNKNTGLQGGVFYIDGFSELDVHNSGFSNNFAVASSIAYAQNQGIISFETCNFSRNKVLTIGILEVFDSTSISSFTNSTFDEVQFATKEEIINELNDKTNCQYLWFASNSYIEYLNNNHELLDTSIVHALLSITEANFNFNYGNEIKDLKYASVLYGYHARISMFDNYIHNLTLESSAFLLTESNLIINSSTISEMYSLISEEPYILQFSTDSKVVLINTNFTDSLVAVINGFDSVLEIDGVWFSNIVSNKRIVDCYNVRDILITDFNTLNCKSSVDTEMIKFRKCTIDLFSDSTFVNSQFYTFKFKDSVIKNFTRNLIDGINKAMDVDGTVLNIYNTTIKNMVQNEQQADVIQSALNSDGSAIGKS